MKRLAIGSDPGDNRKTKGIFGELSANEAFKSKGGGSTNERSMLRVMKFCSKNKQKKRVFPKKWKQEHENTIKEVKNIQEKQTNFTKVL